MVLNYRRMDVVHTAGSMDEEDDDTFLASL